MTKRYLLPITFTALLGGAVFPACTQPADVQNPSAAEPLCAEDSPAAATARHGVFWMTCQEAQPTLNDNRFVFWDGPNYFLFGKLTYSIDPGGQGADFLQYSDDATCDGQTCEATDHVVLFSPVGGAPQTFTQPLSWKTRKFTPGMDLFLFSNAGLQVPCAAYPVKGQDCQAVVSALQGFAAQQGITFTNLQLSPSWCN